MRRPKTDDQGSQRAASPYVTALTWLSRRELSEAQVRQRLARRQFEADAINDAIARLKNEGAIDDTRVAGAMARTQTSIKRRGKVRVRQEMIRAGLSTSVIRDTLEQVFENLDHDALIESALAKRLRHGVLIADEREYARLYRYLLAQGFESDQVQKALRARRHK